jgi:hypothetical protein
MGCCDAIVDARRDLLEAALVLDDVSFDSGLDVGG